MSERVPRKPPAALVDQWPDTPTSDRAVARDASLDERTIRHVMAGSVWPDLLTVSRLEHVLGVNLYPGAN